MYGPEPIRVGVSIADQAAAHSVPLLVLAALRWRQRTGKGQHLDLSMLNVLRWISGLAHPDGARALRSVAVLRVADGWVALERPVGPSCDLEPMKAMTRRETIAALGASGQPAVAILELPEVFAQEWVRARGLIQRREAGAGEWVPILSAPFRLGRWPLPTGRLTGTAGADSERLLGAGESAS